MNEIEIEMKKRESAYQYFSQTKSTECYQFRKNMLDESKENLCSILGIEYEDGKTSYESIREDGNLTRFELDELVQSGINASMVSNVKKYHHQFFDGEEFETYSVGLPSDIEVAFLTREVALQYICNVIVRTGGNAVAFSYLKLEGNMRFVIQGLGLDDEATRQMIYSLEIREAGRFVVLLIANNKVWEFFNELFKIDFVTMHKALELLVESNDQVNNNYKVELAAIDGKAYYLYPFF